MESKKKVAIRPLPNKRDMREMIAASIASFSQAIPSFATGLEAGMLATAANYAGMRLYSFLGELGEIVEEIEASGADVGEQMTKLYETLQLLREVPNRDKAYIDALRNLHALAFKTGSDNSEILAINSAIETARRLGTTEILCLTAAYKFSKRDFEEPLLSDLLSLTSQGLGTEVGEEWLKVVAKAINFPDLEYVMLAEINLEKEGLIAERTYEQHSPTNRSYRYIATPNFRLTKRGLKLASLIAEGGDLFEG